MTIVNQNTLSTRTGGTLSFHQTKHRDNKEHYCNNCNLKSESNAPKIIAQILGTHCRKNKSINNKNTNVCIKCHSIPALLTYLYQFAGVQNAAPTLFSCP
jgi:hypothetical protein